MPVSMQEATSESPSRSWAGSKPEASRLTRRNARRRVPYLVLGVLLVAVCSTAAVFTVLRVGDREPVLVLARDVSVGEVLTAQDLRQVPVSADSGMDLVSAEQARSVLGKPVAYSLPAGTALSRAVLGQPQIPPPGQGRVAVAVQPGRFPPKLAAGTTVSVVVTPTDDSGSQESASAGPWSAAVVDVVPPEHGRNTVVSLRLPVAGARAIAAVPADRLSLVTIPAGGQ